ncbi:MAG: prepilin-type N-terminal cleavage/methylation domain-containing protein [Gemmatimonadetes bacterium]|nr:prepilin-type N-terminal cleavage/methylation domain-containing protein [Gemmatimonadota bacterium]
MSRPARPLRRCGRGRGGLAALPPCAWRLRAAQPGFTLVEVMVALVVLTISMLALASTLGFLLMQVRNADVRSERAAALQQVIETLRATPYDNLQDRLETAPAVVGSFQIWWSVSTTSRDLKRIALYTRGPAYLAGEGWVRAAQDTFEVSIARGRPNT